MVLTINLYNCVRSRDFVPYDLQLLNPALVQFLLYSDKNPKFLLSCSMLLFSNFCIYKLLKCHTHIILYVFWIHFMYLIYLVCSLLILEFFCRCSTCNIHWTCILVFNFLLWIEHKSWRNISCIPTIINCWWLYWSL